MGKFATVFFLFIYCRFPRNKIKASAPMGRGEREGSEGVNSQGLSILRTTKRCFVLAWSILLI
jgi:hypothetical protein